MRQYIEINGEDVEIEPTELLDVKLIEGDRTLCPCCCERADMDGNVRHASDCAAALSQPRISVADGCPEHPGEPCIIGGPYANHGW